MKRAALLAAGLVGLLAATATASTASTTYTRQAAHSRPGFGGAQIAFSNSQYWNQCGVSSAWRVNGQVRLVTAGHCTYRMGSTVRLHSYTGGLLGSVVTARYGSGRDWALIKPAVSVSQYAYHGSAGTRTLIRYDGFTSATKGMKVCVSGAMRGTSCGWTVSRWVHEYDLSGRDLGVQVEATHALVNGRCPADSGDSGSPVVQLASDGTWYLGQMSAGQSYRSYCTMSFVGVNTLMQQIGGQPITRATP